MGRIEHRHDFRLLVVIQITTSPTSVATKRNTRRQLPETFTAQISGLPSLFLAVGFDAVIPSVLYVRDFSKWIAVGVQAAVSSNSPPHDEPAFFVWWQMTYTKPISQRKSLWERACPAKQATRWMAPASPVFAGQARSHTEFASRSNTMSRAVLPWLNRCFQ